MDETDIFDVIFFEKQEGQLCAQHCLNNLIQQQMFGAVDLADIAKQLDDSERGLYSSINATRDSVNYDDSGFFSVQVISKALELLGLSMVGWKSQHKEAVQARTDPASGARSYICNHRQHWFTIRRFGPHHWFNLNSLLSQPEYITHTHLDLFLKQLEQEGYSIFVIVGELPQSIADDFFAANNFAPEILRAIFCNVKPASKPANASENADSTSPEDQELQRALLMSRQADEDDDPSLKQALELSRQQEEEDELRRALELSKASCGGGASVPAAKGDSFDEDSQIKKALEISRQQALLDMPSTSAGPRLPTAAASSSSSGAVTSHAKANGDVGHRIYPDIPSFQLPPAFASSIAAASAAASAPCQPPSGAELDAATLRMKRLEFLNNKKPDSK